MEKEENKNRNKNNITIKILIALVILLIAGIGITIAYFSSRSASDAKIITTGNLTINYEEDEGSNINLPNLYPIRDNEMQDKATKIRFRAHNESDIDAYMDITIEDIVIDEVLKNLEFKWALYETDSSYSELGTKINNGNFRNVGDDKKQLIGNNIEINGEQTKYYDLYIWIRETDLSQDELSNKEFTGKIVINGRQTEGKKLLSQVIKDNNGTITETTPDFTQVPNGDEGLIKGTDEDGETYYFRGKVEDNYVKFNGLKWKTDATIWRIPYNDGTDLYDVGSTREEVEEWCTSYSGDYHYDSSEECKADIEEAGYKVGDDMLFRIVRINGDGTIRLILDGYTGKGKFNETYNDEKYVGYTYDNKSANIQQGGQTSTIKTYLDNWYDSSLKTNYDKYIANTRFCNDTTVSSTLGKAIYYGASSRISEPSYPSSVPLTFECGNTEKTYGGEYDLKVGLITTDEAQAAGGMGYNSSAFYMAGTSPYFWTASPYSFSGGYAYVWGVSGNGGMGNYPVSNGNAVRPAVNLRADLLYSGGDGSKEKPYIVK